MVAKSSEDIRYFDEQIGFIVYLLKTIYSRRSSGRTSLTSSLSRLFTGEVMSVARCLRSLPTLGSNFSLRISSSNNETLLVYRDPWRRSRQSDCSGRLGGQFQRLPPLSGLQSYLGCFLQKT